MRAPTILTSFPLAVALLAPVHAQEVRTGADAFGTWQADAPGVSRHIRPADLPPPSHHQNDPEAPDFERMPKVVDAPQGKMPNVPQGFTVQVFAKDLNKPRVIRIAPNGDIFVAESGSGRVLVFPAEAAKGGSATPEVFTENLDRPFGIAFYPPADPRYVYVAAANQVVRYPYRSGDRKATGPAEVIIADIPTKRHWTRDLAVSRDGQRLFVSIGSASNVAAGMPNKSSEEIQGLREDARARRDLGRGREPRPWCACSIRKAGASAILRPACATAPAWPFSPAPTPCGARATNATTSAPIWCLIS